MPESQVVAEYLPLRGRFMYKLTPDSAASPHVCARDRFIYHNTVTVRSYVRPFTAMQPFGHEEAAHRHAERMLSNRRAASATIHNMYVHGWMFMHGCIYCIGICMCMGGCLCIGICMCMCMGGCLCMICA